MRSDIDLMGYDYMRRLSIYSIVFTLFIILAYTYNGGFCITSLMSYSMLFMLFDFIVMYAVIMSGLTILKGVRIPISLYSIYVIYIIITVEKYIIFAMTEYGIPCMLYILSNALAISLLLDTVYIVSLKRR